MPAAREGSLRLITPLVKPEWRSELHHDVNRGLHTHGLDGVICFFSFCAFLQEDGQWDGDSCLSGRPYSLYLVW